MPRVEPNQDPHPNEVIALQLLPSGNVEIELANGDRAVLARSDQVSAELAGAGLTTDQLLAQLAPDRRGPFPVGVRFYRRVVGDQGERHITFAADN